MQKYTPTSQFERILHQPEPVLTSSTQHELQLQDSLDAATQAMKRLTERKEASNRAEAARVKAYIEEEYGKVTAGVKGLHVVNATDVPAPPVSKNISNIPTAAATASSRPLPQCGSALSERGKAKENRAGKPIRSSPSRAAATAAAAVGATSAFPLASPTTATAPTTSLASSRLAAQTAKALAIASSRLQALPPQKQQHVLPTAASTARHASDATAAGEGKREHFTTGFPVPYIDSGFKSLTQWAKVSYEEALVTALGPQGDVHRYRDQHLMPNRLLVAVACYLLNEVLTRDSSLAPLWAMLRLPILDAVFSPQLISADTARRVVARQERRQQQHQQSGRDDSLATATTATSTDREAASDGEEEQESGAAPPYHLPREAASYGAMVDFSDFRLWCEEVQGARDDNATLLARVQALKNVVGRSRLVLQLAQRRVERGRLRGIFVGWRAHTRRAARTREVAITVADSVTLRARQAACFLRWRRITLTGRAHRLREAIIGLERDMHAQAETHKADVLALRAQLQNEVATHATANLKNETLRIQMVESYNFECSVLHAALKKARERATLFQTHARRWERLAKTFRPQVLCPPVSQPLLQLGRQLRGWERELADRVVLAQRPVTGVVASASSAFLRERGSLLKDSTSPLSTSGTASATIGTRSVLALPEGPATAGVPATVAKPSTGKGRDSTFSSVYLRQTAVSAVLEKFLLRWVNYVMTNVTRGGGGVEAQELLFRLQQQQQEQLQQQQQQEQQTRRVSHAKKLNARKDNGNNTDSSNKGDLHEPNSVPFSFWIPVKTLEPRKTLKVSAKQSAENRAKDSKNEGVSSSRIRSALKKGGKSAKEEAAAAAAAAAAASADAEGPANHLTLFALRCLVGELLRQFETQRALMTCADASPITVSDAPTGHDERHPHLQAPHEDFLSKAAAGGAEAAHEQGGSGHKGGAALTVPEREGVKAGGEGVSSVVAGGPWGAELEAARLQRAMLAPTTRTAACEPASSTGACSSPPRAVLALEIGNQRDALGVIPYAFNAPLLPATANGNDRRPPTTTTFASDVANLDVSANVNSYLKFLGQGGSGGGAAAQITSSPLEGSGLTRASSPRPAAADHVPPPLILDPVFTDLAQLLVAFSSGGLYPPLLLYAKTGPGTPTPNGEQLYHFLFPSDRLKQYNHSAMLWVLASLFTGYARCCNGPEPFLPTTTPAATSAIAKKKGTKKGSTKKHTSPVAVGVTAGSAFSSTPAVSRPGSSAASARAPGKVAATFTPNALPEAKGTYIISSSTVLTRTPSKPAAAAATNSNANSDWKDGTQKASRRTHRTVSVLGGGGSHSANSSRHSSPKTAGSPRQDASGSGRDRRARSQIVSAGSKGASLLGRHHATIDDTPADMDVYLGFCDPDVPASDGEENSTRAGYGRGDGCDDDEEADEARRAREEAELEAATADVVNAEERAMERRRRLRLLRSGLLTPKEERRLRSGILGSLPTDAAAAAGSKDSKLRASAFSPHDEDDDDEMDGVDKDNDMGSASSSTSSSSASTASLDRQETDGAVVRKASSSSALGAPAPGEKVSRYQRTRGNKRASCTSGPFNNGSTAGPSAAVSGGGAGHRDAGLVRTAEERRDQEQDHSLARREADFWEEDPVTEGVIPAPADLGADSDDENYAHRGRNAEGAKNGEKRLQPPPHAAGGTVAHDGDGSADGDASDDEETEDLYDGCTRRQRRILKHFPHRSAAFDGVRRSSASVLSWQLKGRKSTAGQRSSVVSTAGGAYEAASAAMVVGERTERRRRARRRRRALRTFVELTVIDRERRQQWLALARVVTALVTRLGVLDVMPRGRRREPSSASARSSVSGGGGGGVGGGLSDWDLEGDNESSSTGTFSPDTTDTKRKHFLLDQSRPFSPGDRRQNSPAARGEGGRSPRGRDGEPLSSTHPTSHKTREGSAPRTQRAATVAEGSSAAESTETAKTARTSLYSQRQQQRLQKLAEKERCNQPDALFPSLANRGPAPPPPQPRPPSPSLIPQGPLDPYVSRPSPQVLSQAEQQQQQHFKGSDQLRFDIKTKHTR